MNPAPGLSPRLRAMEPFGLEVRLPEGTEFGALPVELLRAWVKDHGVVVLRGLRSLRRAELPAAGRRLGPLLPWSFGSVNELHVKPGTANYLYTDRAVPLHWDGAFLPRAPRLLMFHCVEAPPPGSGGETLFVDTARLWRGLPERLQAEWRGLRVEGATDRLAHYGGRFAVDLLAHHPLTGEPVLRYAEPVDDLNPVQIRLPGLSPQRAARRMAEIRRRLYAPDVLLAHRWEAGDLLIADNDRLLHGRRTFTAPDGQRPPRHLRRVSVLPPERPPLQWLRDSLRIRRPEFLVAEVPILLIPAWLSAPGPVMTEAFAVVALLGLGLFHAGDMVNCLEDRDLDALYKTPTSEAVYGLGVQNVRWQIAATVLLCLALAAWLASLPGRSWVGPWVIAGLWLGWSYSAPPIRWKARGLWQILALWALIFVGPMVLATAAFLPYPSPDQLALFMVFGLAQQGIVLVNTAEDLREDREMGLYTSAAALGAAGSLRASAAMAGLGGVLLVGLLIRAGADSPLPLLPLAAGWIWAVAEIGRGAWKAGSGTAEEAEARCRDLAKRVPLWLTAVAWGTLWAVGWLRWG